MLGKKKASTWASSLSKSGGDLKPERSDSAGSNNVNATNATSEDELRFLFEITNVTGFSTIKPSVPAFVVLSHPGINYEPPQKQQQQKNQSSQQTNNQQIPNNSTTTPTTPTSPPPPQFSHKITLALQSDKTTAIPVEATTSQFVVDRVLGPNKLSRDVKLRLTLPEPDMVQSPGSAKKEKKIAKVHLDLAKLKQSALDRSDKFDSDMTIEQHAKLQCVGSALLTLFFKVTISKPSSVCDTPPPPVVIPEVKELEKGEALIETLIPPGPLGARISNFCIPPKVMELVILPNGRAGPLAGHVPPGAMLYSFDDELTASWDALTLRDNLLRSGNRVRKLVWKVREEDSSPDQQSASPQENGSSDNGKSKSSPTNNPLPTTNNSDATAANPNNSNSPPASYESPRSPSHQKQASPPSNHHHHHHHHTNNQNDNDDDYLYHSSQINTEVRASISRIFSKEPTTATTTTTTNDLSTLSSPHQHQSLTTSSLQSLQQGFASRPPPQQEIFVTANNSEYDDKDSSLSEFSIFTGAEDVQDTVAHVVSIHNYVWSNNDAHVLFVVTLIDPITLRATKVLKRYSDFANLRLSFMSQYLQVYGNSVVGDTRKLRPNPIPDLPPKYSLGAILHKSVGFLDGFIEQRRRQLEEWLRSIFDQIMQDPNTWQFLQSSLDKFFSSSASADMPRDRSSSSDVDTSAIVKKLAADNNTTIITATTAAAAATTTVASSHNTTPTVAAAAATTKTVRGERVDDSFSDDSDGNEDTYLHVIGSSGTKPVNEAAFVVRNLDTGETYSLLDSHT